MSVNCVLYTGKLVKLGAGKVTTGRWRVVSVIELVWGGV